MFADSFQLCTPEHIFTLKRFAVIECIIAKLFKVCRHLYRCEIGAAGKCVVTDSSNAIRQRNTLQCFTVLECLIHIAHALGELN